MSATVSCPTCGESHLGSYCKNETCVFARGIQMQIADAVRAEREACALVAEMAGMYRSRVSDIRMSEHIASAIRERGNA